MTTSSHRQTRSVNRCATLLVAVLILLAGGRMWAGSYVQNFSSGTVGTQMIGGGDTSTLSASASTITTAVRIWAQGNKGLQLMGTLGGNSASWKMPDLDAGKEIQAFDATFNSATYRANGNVGTIPGAGWSLNFGTIPTGNGVGEGGFVMPNGIVMAWDIFNNGGTDNPSIEVFCNGVSVGNFPSATLTDSPVCDSGTFTLTNPVSGGVTAPIAFNATAATVQTAMRAVVGWEAVTVGGIAASWSVNHGVVGAYSDPVSDNSAIVPANSAINVTKTAAGTATTNEQWSIAMRAYRGRAVAIHWDYNGLDVTVNGATIFTDLPTPGFVPAAGNKFAFSARCESSNTMDFFVDDVALTTTQLLPVETGGPVISEFMADNSNTFEDEDTDSSDWIEIYNGQNATVNLAGWRLTNALGNNAMWTFPTVSMGPYSYKIVYASGKNRTVAAGQLHTNFTLPKGGGYLALVKADGVTLATEFTYGAQYADVSYGEKGPGRTLGYLQPATPGTKAPYSTAQAAGGPSEDVVWSRVGGIITGSTPVAITAPIAAGAVVRYTTDNTEPSSASPIYNSASPPAAFTVTATATLRARIFTPGLLPGAVSSRTFLLIDSTLTNYNGSGQVFSSHLPIIVIDSYGVPVDNYTDAASRPYRLSYAVALDKDPVSGRASLTQATVDFQGRGGTHVRGSSSAGFPQRQYAWETWDNSNNDKDASILGMPAESDWVLYAPYDDKVLFRNFLIYSRMRQLTGGDGFAMRAKFCEVFFNQEPGQPVSVSDYRGVYVLMEKIKINKDRVDLQKLNLLTTDPTAITGGYILKHDRVNTGDTVISTPNGVQIGSVDPDQWNTAQTSYLQTYFNNFENALNGANFGDAALGYQAYIERDSFIYNQWFIEIAKQIDGYRLSQYFWKDRGGKVKNGPVWDYNLALSNADYLEGYVPTGWYYTQLAGADYAWYPRLHQHTTGASPYELRHWDLYWELRRNLFATANILGEIDVEAATLLNGSTTRVTNSMAALPPLQENSVMRHYRKWPVLGIYLWPNAPGFDQRIYFNSNGVVNTGEVDFMKDWLTKRLIWIDDQNFSGTVIYRPPNFSQYGGNVNAGTQLTMTSYTGTAPSGFSYATGTIYYTTDGSDPRNAAGTPAGTAYTVPVALSASQTVKARLYNAGAWSPVTTSTFIVDAVPASAANLVVSELMYNPLNATNAEIALGYSTSDFEYIELLNVSAGNVDLSNIAFTEGVLFNFGTNNPSVLTVPPGGRVVVVGGNGAFLSRYGSNPAVKIAGTFSGSFSNSGERTTLVGASGATIAQFTYGHTEPWPVDAAGGVYNNAAPPQLIGGGYSLVLNNPAAGIDYNSGANWRSSAQIGGTPGLASGAAFTGQAGGDTDGDGSSDFLEYATGSNMANPASRNLPVVAIAPFTLLIGTDNYLRIDYRRNLAADGVNFTVQLSTNLTSWAGDASAVTYYGSHNNGDGTATVTYRSTAPISPAQPRCYLRLLVSP